MDSSAAPALPELCFAKSPVRYSMRPHLQPAFPCLAGLFSVWQSVDFVNILRRRSMSGGLILHFFRLLWSIQYADLDLGDAGVVALVAFVDGIDEQLYIVGIDRFIEKQGMLCHRVIKFV